VEDVNKARLKACHFQVIKTIGRGAYGEVQLVRHQHTRKVYAMKSLSKVEMVKTCCFTFPICIFSVKISD